MKLLVTGASGQLGSELRRCLESGCAEIGPLPVEYNGACVDYADHEDLDVSNSCAVHAWFKEKGPYDLVINCAAFTDVDGCEREEAAAYHVNASGPENLGREIAVTGGKLIHVSTDYVFPGIDEIPRVESDPACPVSAYGRTKWAGEVLVQAVCPRSFIVRTAWLYGYVGKNFVKTMIRQAISGGKISVVSDQLGNPTNANDLAHELLKIGLTKNYGVYHCTNEGACSWFDFACAVVDLAGIPCEKEPILSCEYKRRFPQSADRPHFSSLENRHLTETVGNEMRPWRKALETYMSRLKESRG